MTQVYLIQVPNQARGMCLYGKNKTLVVKDNPDPTEPEAFA